jgi:hypothetical protein
MRTLQPAHRNKNERARSLPTWGGTYKNERARSLPAWGGTFVADMEPARPFSTTEAAR